MEKVYTIWNKFLIDSTCQIIRRSAFTALLFLILLAMYMTAYGEAMSISEYLLISILSLLFYYALISFSLKKVVPKILQRDRIGKYILYLFGITLAMTIFQIISSYIIEEQFGIAHNAYNSKFEYLLYLFVLYFLNCFFLMGFFITVLLKRWILDSQHISQLQKERLSSELQELKSRIRPDFLFNMLNKANVLAKIDSEGASEILLKLSHILRYQLYDSKRERVMLRSEIIFMKDYLYLEKMRSDNFMFTITEIGNVRSVSIPALLFIPAIETATRYIAIHGNGNNSSVDIEIRVDKSALHFICHISKLNEINPFLTEREILSKQIELIYGKNSSILISSTELIYMTHITICL